MIRPLCFALLLATPGAAQTVSPGLEHANPEMSAPARREIRQRVEEFLKRLGDRDVAAVRALLAPKMLIAVVRQRPSTGAQGDGTFANTYQTGEEFLAQFEKNAAQPKFEEPLTNVVVTIDSDRLAYLRADFTVVREGKVASSGVDHFTLVKEADGWKIAMIAYTSLPAKP
jgi:ketosteroid isomerase-like protein